MSGEEDITTQEKNLGIPSHVSLRDYFAAAALTGLCTGHEISNPETMAAMPNIMSFISYEIADAMLKARES